LGHYRRLYSQFGRPTLRRLGRGELQYRKPAGYEIVSGINSYNHEQEFLIHTASSAPEPTSLGLFGLGLAGAFAARRWRKK
jgi:hypothetical protein